MKRATVYFENVRNHLLTMVSFQDFMAISKECLNEKP